MKEIKHGHMKSMTKLSEEDLHRCLASLSFIAHCRELNLKLALATSADKGKVLTNLREIGIPPEKFDAVVNGLDVEKKKPDPEIFLTAAEEINLTNPECLIVEDAINGVEAAKAAGSKCLALTTSFTAEELQKADWIAPTLAEVPDEAILHGEVDITES